MLSSGGALDCMLMPNQLNTQPIIVDCAFASWEKDSKLALPQAVSTGEDKDSTPTEAPVPSRARFAQHTAAYGLLTDLAPLEARCTHRRDQNRQIQLLARVPGETYSLAQIQDLCHTIGTTLCRFDIGRSSLENSLMNPPVELDLARARQAAVREILASEDARKAVDAILTGSATDLATVIKFIAPPWGQSRTADSFRATGDSLERLAQLSTGAPKLQSELLNSTIEDLRGFSESKAHRYFREGICRVGRDVALCSEAPLTNRIFSRYLPGWLGPKGLAFVGGATALSLFGAATQSQETLVAGGVILSVSPIILHNKESYDEYLFFSPVAKVLWRDPQFGRALTALGLLDELRALSRLPDQYQGGGVFPDLIESPRHVLQVTEGHNPLLALNNGLSVANDFSFDSGVIKGLTGPNSGGKSTFGRTGIQLQCLGQIGAPVPARSCTLSMADELLYQAQKFNQLSDPEGRFGTELKETKELFERASNRTFAIFDELAQGTTHQESREVASYIIEGLSRLGISGVLITHDHQLVGSLSKSGFVEPVQVELRKDLPTHRVIPGISTTSHALRVARKIGLGPDDVRRLVEERLAAQQTLQN